LCDEGVDVSTGGRCRVATSERTRQILKAESDDQRPLNQLNAANLVGAIPAIARGGERAGQRALRFTALSDISE